MDNINLPMRKGTMDDITQENEPSSAMDGTQMDGTQSETGLDSMSSKGAKKIYEKEALIIIDYSGLDDDLKEVGIVCKLKKNV
jgi:structural maintenance of chromosome 1